MKEINEDTDEETCSESDLIIHRLEEIEISFDNTIKRILELSNKQTELHFAERERENKRKTVRSILCCLIICICVLFYQSLYLDYNSHMNEKYFHKINYIDERVDELYEKSIQENQKSN